MVPVDPIALEQSARKQMSFESLTLFLSDFCVCRYRLRLPTLPPLSVQIKLGINGNCKDCTCPIDKRSKRCRLCHSIKLANTRFPFMKRHPRKCIDCGDCTSYQSAHGKRHCRLCYNKHRTDRAIERAQMIRPISRPNNGTGYQDKDGIWHEAWEEPLPGLSVTFGWSSLRKCWKGYKIARGNDNEELGRLYAGRIYFLTHLLNLEQPVLPDFDAECYSVDYHIPFRPDSFGGQYFPPNYKS